MALPPTRVLPDGWEPSPEKMAALDSEFGRVVDLRYLLRRFRNHYVEGQTSRNWDAKFENWVLTEAARATDLEGTDDLGIPRTQRKTSSVQPAQPGDPDYFDPDLIFDPELVFRNGTESKEQP
jgi:hypothetical protein